VKTAKLLTQFSPMFKNVLFVLFLVLFCGQIWSQVTVEFRISAVSSDVGDMDSLASLGNSGNSDPRWEFQVTDVPFGTTQASFQFNAGLNCPGSIGLANTFFSQTYSCSAPTSFNFQWRGYERDGSGIGEADTGPQIVNIPIGSLAFPQAAFTPVATYSLRCCRYGRMPRSCWNCNVDNNFSNIELSERCHRIRLCLRSLVRVMFPAQLMQGSALQAR
jgi:hypothetical protein